MPNRAFSMLKLNLSWPTKLTNIRIGLNDRLRHLWDYNTFHVNKKKAIDIKKKSISILRGKWASSLCHSSVVILHFPSLLFIRGNDHNQIYIYIVRVLGSWSFRKVLRLFYHIYIQKGNSWMIVILLGSLGRECWVMSEARGLEGQIEETLDSFS